MFEEMQGIVVSVLETLIEAEMIKQKNNQKNNGRVKALLVDLIDLHLCDAFIQSNSSQTS